MYECYECTICFKHGRYPLPPPVFDVDQPNRSASWRATQTGSYMIEIKIGNMLSQHSSGHLRQT